MHVGRNMKGRLKMKTLMIGEFGIQNTKELIKFGATLAHLGFDLKNGFQLDEEIPNLIAAGSAAVPALDEFDKVDDELLDLAPEELEGLVAYTDSLLDDLDFVVDDTQAAMLDFINGALVITRGAMKLKKKS